MIPQLWKRWVWMDVNLRGESLRKEHDTSTRRLPPFQRRSRRGKPGEAALLIHHRSNSAAIDHSLTEQTERTLSSKWEASRCIL